MSNSIPSRELMISFSFLFPKALESGDTKDYTGRISESVQRAIENELARLGIEHIWDSTKFLHLGTEIIPDSIRCSECGTWVVPEENSHPTSVVASGWRVEDDRILCDQCWSLFDGNKIPITGELR